MPALMTLILLFKSLSPSMHAAAKNVLNCALLIFIKKPTTDLAVLVFSLPRCSAVISGEVLVETLNPTGIRELKEELDEVRENFAAHMFFCTVPRS